MSASHTSSQSSMYHLAERILKKRRHRPSKESETDLSKSSLIHELEVHRIELEIQNEELKLARDSAEQIRDRYQDLYDSAPVAYLTLNAKTSIIEANFMAGALLGIDCNSLIGNHFTQYIVREDQDIFYLYQKSVVKHASGRSCELRLRSVRGNVRHVRIQGLAIVDSETKGKTLRIVIGDITDAKRMQLELEEAKLRLEAGVRERTAELLETNNALQAEIRNRRKTEATLQESEHRLADAQKIAHIGSWSWTVATGAMEWSDEMYHILDLPRSTRPSYQLFIRRMHRDDRKLARLAAQQAIQGRQKSYALEHRIVTARNAVSRISIVAYIKRSGPKNEIQVVGTSQDITNLRNLESDILRISEQEKQRFAVDLHDGLAQELAGVGFLCTKLESALKLKSLPEADQVREIREQLSKSIAEARALARGLFPVEVADNGLSCALQQMALRVSKTHLVNCSFKTKKIVCVEDNVLATHLYWIAHEATANAIKHGKATRIEIKLALISQRLVLNICDNGVGLPVTKKHREGLGLRSMAYRARLVNGMLFIRKLNEGTLVSCKVDFEGRAPQLDTSVTG